MHLFVPILLASIASLTSAGEMQRPDFDHTFSETHTHPVPPAGGAPGWGKVTSFVGGSKCPQDTGGRVLYAEPGFCTKRTAYAAGDPLKVDFGTGTDAVNKITFYTDDFCQTAARMGPVDKETQGSGCTTLGENINSFQPTA